MDKVDRLRKPKRATAAPGRKDSASASHALRASETRFAAAFDSSPVPMAITSLAEGRYIEVNDAFVKQIGFESPNA